jgi:hypothetical protein
LNADHFVIGREEVLPQETRIMMVIVMMGVICGVGVSAHA